MKKFWVLTASLCELEAMLNAADSPALFPWTLVHGGRGYVAVFMRMQSPVSTAISDQELAAGSLARYIVSPADAASAAAEVSLSRE